MEEKELTQGQEEIEATTTEVEATEEKAPMYVGYVVGVEDNSGFRILNSTGRNLTIRDHLEASMTIDNNIVAIMLEQENPLEALRTYLAIRNEGAGDALSVLIDFSTMDALDKAAAKSIVSEFYSKPEEDK
jgi:hypothetical protein